MACSMSSASSLRTSPTMIRSGRIRRALTTRSRCRTVPLPSMLGGRVSSRTTCRCRSSSSAASSIVTTRSWSGMKLERMLSSVVLPAPVPPETTTLRRQPDGRLEELFHRLGPGLAADEVFRRRACPSGKRRIDNTAPSSASGGMIALTREPSASRASTIGLDSSIRRPIELTMRSMICWRCRSSLKVTSVGSSRPFRST